MAKFAPLFVAAALLAGLVIVAAPAEAAPCYQQGQPAPPNAPNTNLLLAYCQNAANAWLTTLFVGRPGTYGVIAFGDRVVYDTLGGTTAQGYATCVQNAGVPPTEDPLRTFHACGTNAQSLYRCNETGATVTCSQTWALKMGGDVDKLYLNTLFVCVGAYSYFAPGSPSGLPVAPPALPVSPAMACTLPFFLPPGAPTPPAPLTWPLSTRALVDYVLP